MHSHKDTQSESGDSGYDSKGSFKIDSTKASFKSSFQAYDSSSKIKSSSGDCKSSNLFSNNQLSSAKGLNDNNNNAQKQNFCIMCKCNKRSYSIEEQ